MMATALIASVGSVAEVSAPLLPEPELAWKNVTVNGRKTAVFTLFIDSHGIAWVGTNGGLFFYDGVGTHIVGDRVLDGAQVYAIVERDDRLWIGTNNGLLYYDYRTGVVESCAVATKKEIRSLLIVDNTLWIGGLYGIQCLDLGSGALADCSAGLPHHSVYSLLRDSRGILYAGTYGGPARYDSATGRFIPMSVRVAGGGNNEIFANCLLESNDHRSIYIGAEGGLYMYTPADDNWTTVEALSGNVVKSLAYTANGVLIAGTDDGLFAIEGDAVRHYRHDSRHTATLSDNEIWCLLADRGGNIWAGHARGFSIASNSAATRTIHLNALTHSGEGNEIYVIFRDSFGDLWMGGTNGVIRIAADGSRHWYRHSDTPMSLSHNRVRAITEDSEHNLWLATDAGIDRYNRATDAFEVFHITDSRGEHNSNWVYAITEDDDHLWVGSFIGGLHYVDKARLTLPGSTVVADLSINSDTPVDGDTLAVNDLVNKVVKDARGDLWVLFFRDSALLRLNLGTRRGVRYDINALTGGYPTDMCADSRGRIWCAYRGGVVVFDADAEPHIVNLPHTNSDEGVLTIAPVGDDVWLSTLSNVWRFDGASLAYTLLPIPQKAYNAIYKDVASDKVLLGGTDCIVEVDYNDIAATADFKQIKFVLNLGVGNSPTSALIDDYTDGLSLPYGGSVSLIVSTLDYSPESVQRYMYKLAANPTDTIDGWILLPEGVNAISLSDLTMGDYSLLVRSVGSPVAPVAIPLCVAAPAALSWWAISIYVLLIVAGIVAAIWYTRRRNINKFREQKRIEALQNVEKKLSFLSDISHDLKTPLSMIIGPVSVLKQRTDDPDTRHTLDTVYENAVRLNDMIHRTVELQHLDESVDNMLILSTFDVVDFCRGVFDAFRESNRAKKFVFHANYPHLYIEADAVKFESVITNLLSNACKYSDDGATISIGIDRVDDRVEVVVSDDGVGIPEADQSLVFQRMYRSPSTATTHEGTGIGLYLIKKYLELMHGNIDLFSRPGQGTSFTVSLPLTDSVATAEGDSAPAPAGNKPLVLIVEDNSQIASFIRSLLADKYACVHSADGRSGLSLAASCNPDLIIVDEMMPIMGGLDMVSRLKQNPRLATIPIIMLTARSDNDTETRSVRAGIDVFMTKPFEPEVLLGRIDLLLRARADMRRSVRLDSITEVKPIEVESQSEKQLATIARIIEDNISDPDLNVAFLCEKSGIANKNLYRLVKKYIGVSPIDYIRRVRLQKAAMLIARQRFTIAEVAYMVGFKTPSYFAKCFQEFYGVTPSNYHGDDSNNPA